MSSSILATTVDMQKLRLFMGYWLYFVAPLVPLKSWIFAQNNTKDAATTDTAIDTATHTNAATATNTVSTSTSAPVDATQNGSSNSTAPSTTTSGTSNGTSTSSSPEQPGSSPLFKRDLQSTDLILAATGIVAGFASGLLGIGGGTIVTPLLALCTGLPQMTVVGTSLAGMVAPSGMALAQHARLGNVDWRMAAALAAGSYIGSLSGSQLVLQAPPFLLEMCFATGMAFLGHKTLAVARATAAATAAAKKAAQAAAAGGAATAAAAAARPGAAAVASQLKP